MSAVSNFAGDALLHQSGNYEPQRKSNFAAVIYGVGDTDTLVLSLASCNVPEITIVEGRIKYFNETMKFAGSIAPFPDGSMVFNDFIDRSTLQTLANWMKQVANFSTGGIGWARDYKKKGSIILLPPSMPGGGVGAVTSSPYRNRVWDMHGVWIKTLKYDDLSHDDDGSTPARITATFALDRCIPALMSQAAAAS